MTRRRSRSRLAPSPLPPAARSLPPRRSGSRARPTTAESDDVPRGDYKGGPREGTKSGRGRRVIHCEAGGTADKETRRHRDGATETPIRARPLLLVSPVSLSPCLPWSRRRRGVDYCATPAGPRRDVPAPFLFFGTYLGILLSKNAAEGFIASATA